MLLVELLDSDALMVLKPFSLMAKLAKLVGPTMMLHWVTCYSAAHLCKPALPSTDDAVGVPVSSAKAAHTCGDLRLSSAAPRNFVALLGS